MKIKKVEICGFKSFVDRTVVVFDHDVTAIVGRELTSLEHLLRGDKSDPTNEKEGLLDTGTALVERLKKIGHEG